MNIVRDGDDYAQTSISSWRLKELLAIERAHEKATECLKALVIAWDADQDPEFDDALAKARELVGFKLVEADKL